MKQHGFILKLFGFVCLIQQALNAQKPVLLIDTAVQADAVYLDPLNQIYLVNFSGKSIHKYNSNFGLLKKISFNQGWNHAILDVSDPFKCLLYYPGDYKILVLDESLSVIANYDEAELNAQAAICHYSTDQIGLYTNNGLKLKNYGQQKVLYSEPLYNPDAYHSPLPVQLKSGNEYLYLLRPGYGISRFTNQLFEEKTWLNSGILKMDLNGEQLIYQSGNDLYAFDTRYGTEELFMKNSIPLKSFAMNAGQLILLFEAKLQLYSWKSP